MTAFYCNRCGHHNPEGSNFCSSCGAPLDRPATDDPPTITLSPVESAGEVGDEDVTVHLGDVPDGDGLLVVKRGPNAGSRFVLSPGTTTVGRHPDSDIFLDDVTVSRRHAEFRREGSGYAVHDVGSLNGTYVNRARIETSALAGGDEVQIGKFRLVYLTAAVRAGLSA